MNTERVKLALTVLREIQETKNLKEGWDVYEPEDSIREGAFPKEDTFDMRDWGAVPEQGKACGTVACMAGWLVLDERINKEGLIPRGPTDDGVFRLTPFYAGHNAQTALEEFFDLSDHDVHWVFGSDKRPDLAAGIGRLEGLLNR